MISKSVPVASVMSDRYIRLVAEAPWPIVLLEETPDGVLEATPNQMARALSMSGDEWFPLGHVEGWEKIADALGPGEKEVRIFSVDGLAYAEHWNLDNNNHAWWSATLKRFADDTWCVFAYNITDQYRYGEMLAAALASNARAYEVLAEVSHELKQPITSVIGLAEVILELAPDPGVAELIGLVISESKVMTGLVDDFMTSGLVASGRMRVESERAAAATIVDELRGMAGTFLGRGVSVTLEGNPDLPVFVDRRRLAQVVRGMIQNAIKYGGPSIEVRAIAAPDRFVVEVHDDGPGVPADEIEMLFEPFSSGSAGRGKGSGIGLTVARSIVADMGGLLEYRTGDGGALFAITLQVESDSFTSGQLDALHEQQALFKELISYDRDAARLRLNNLAFRHRASQVIEEVVRPVMYLVGDGWLRGEVSVPQEHHASSVVQSWLMDAMVRFRPWRQKTVVCVSSPGSHHEIGTASVAVGLAEAGYRVIHLGRGVPVDDLVEAVETSGAVALVMSVTLPEELDGIREIADVLTDHVAAGLIVGVGGYIFANGFPTDDLPCSYLGESLFEAVDSLDTALNEQTTT